MLRIRLVEIEIASALRQAQATGHDPLHQRDASQNASAIRIPDTSRIAFLQPLLLSIDWIDVKAVGIQLLADKAPVVGVAATGRMESEELVGIIALDLLVPIAERFFVPYRRLVVVGVGLHRCFRIDEVGRIEIVRFQLTVNLPQATCRGKRIRGGVVDKVLIAIALRVGIVLRARILVTAVLDEFLEIDLTLLGL